MPTLEPLTVRNQFPDYPIISLPDLEGWEDMSWRNDVCPSFWRNDFLVWIDYPDPREREDFEGCRFIVCRLDFDGCLLVGSATLLETDDWTEVLALVH